MTVAVDPGIVINTIQLTRQVEGGTVMGLSMALLEEVRFDESGVTTSDWRSYPIATMAELPEIKVVLINRPEVESTVKHLRLPMLSQRQRSAERSWMRPARLRAGLR